MLFVGGEGSGVWFSYKGLSMGREGDNVGLYA